MTAVENKIGIFSNLVRTSVYKTKTGSIERKHITTADNKKFAKDTVDNSMKSKNLVAKMDCDAKLHNISKQFTSNKSKHLHIENEFKKLKKFDLF